MKKIILHACCAVCASYPILKLRSLGYEPVIYFFNPNIFPIQEYNIRLNELKNYTKKLNLNLHIDGGEYKDWKNFISGLENEPEKGKRCYKCFLFRLKQTALFAINQNINYFTTTLSVSPHKNSKQIFLASKEIINNCDYKKLSFLPLDFKKENGFLISNQIAKTENFYRQFYCGCEFSFKKN